MLLVKLLGDNTALKRAFDNSMAAAKRFGVGLGKALKTAAVGLSAAFASLSAGLALVGNELRKVFDLGGHLSDVAANTGLLAGEAAILERAFDSAGIAAEKLQPNINRLQKTISEAGRGSSSAQEALARLGLRFEEIAHLSTYEQFKIVAARIAAIESPADRAAAAMAIFGKTGAELLALFSDSGAIDAASTSLGGAADILNRNAAIFDRVSDLLNQAGGKLRGIFIGMAENVAPYLLSVLEQFNKIDFTKIGTGISNAIGTGIEVIRSGKFGELLVATFEFATATWANLFVGAVNGLAKLLEGTFVKAFGGIVASFQAGLVRAVNVAMEAIGKIPGVGQALGLKGFEAPDFATTKKLLEDHQGSGEAEISAAITELMGVLQGKGADVFDTAGAAAKITDILTNAFADFRARTDELADAHNKNLTPAAPTSFEPLEDEEEAPEVKDPELEKAVGLLGRVTTSLGKIGGAGGRGNVSGFDNLAKIGERQTGLLAAANDSLKELVRKAGTGGGTAVFG